MNKKPSFILSSLFIFGVFLNTVVYPVTDVEMGFITTHKFDIFEYDMGEIRRQYREAGYPASEIIENNPIIFSTNARGDMVNYYKMLMNEAAIPPYSLRVLYPLFIRNLSIFWFGEADHESLYFTLITSNLFFVLGTFILLLFTYNQTLSLRQSVLAGLFLITCPSIFKTFPFIFVEIPSVFLFTLLVFLLVKQKYLTWLPLFSIIAILTKDVFITLLIPFSILFLKTRKRTYLFSALCLVGGFILIRQLYGTDPLSVNYDWKVSQGEINFDLLSWHFDSPLRTALTLLKLPYIYLPLIALFFTTLFMKQKGYLRNHIKQNIAWYIWLVAMLVANLMLNGRLLRTSFHTAPILIYLFLQVYSDYRQFFIKKQEALN